jgi:WS/DGAT/MGAT family acyltransferase
METLTTPMHVGGVAILEQPEGGFDFDRLLGVISERIAQVPRYRQVVKWVPGRIANPIWVDDEDFDISYHVRHSALPKPGNDDQLRELVARLQSRPLDRNRPLWEIYVVEGLQGDDDRPRAAIITKTHHAMVDGRSAVDVGAMILDATPETAPTTVEPWRPAPAPSGLALLAGAVADNIRRPAGALDAVRSGVFDARNTATRAVSTAAGFLSAASVARKRAPDSPLNAEIGEQRRYGMAVTELDDYKRVRKAYGGTVNDVVLATVTGALRAWMLTRGEPVTTSTSLRAMVPVSVRSSDQEGALGNRVSSYFVDLPVGEPNPVVRLHQISYSMQAHKEAGQSVAADAIIALSGFAPPTIHSAAARLASGMTKRLFNLVVTNVPGPQMPLWAAGARMLECYPVVPLAKGQAVSVGLTSYNGGVYYGLLADRDAMPDVDVLATSIEDALSELVEGVR